MSVTELERLTDSDRALLAGLEGLISPEVGERLLELASLVPKHLAIVEIGSYKGKSTSYLAKGAQLGAGARVYAVDPGDLPGNPAGRFGFNSEEVKLAFRLQLEAAGVAAGVTRIRDFSRKVASSWFVQHCPYWVGLLFIDGSHTEQDVRGDWNAWSPLLAHGAVVAFDDYRTERNPGVAAVVDSIRWRKCERGPAPLFVGWP